MRFVLVLLVVLVGVMANGVGMAASTVCNGFVCPEDNWVAGNMPPSNCTDYTEYCYGPAGGPYRKIYSCMTCATNYSLKSGTSVGVSGCSPDIPVKVCESNCKGCTNCTSDATWTTVREGYEKRVTRTCDCNTCNETTSYRCAAGWYQSHDRISVSTNTMGTSKATGCSECPPHNDVTAHSEANSKEIAKCYISSTDTWVSTDATGTKTSKFTDACYYNAAE